jgi:hypothetical protein
MMSVFSRRQEESQDRDDDRDSNGRGEDDGQGTHSPSGRGKRQSGSRASLAKNKHIIEEFINVGVPHRVAYDQWTQYEEWSKIFKKESGQAGGASEDRGQDHNDRHEDDDDEGDKKVTVTSKIGPSQRQWQTEIVAQRPGRRIEWEAKGGVQAKGVVTFHHLDDRLTYLQVVIQYKPSGFMETIGNFFRMQRRRVRKDLRLFKNFLELRGEATGEGPGRVRRAGLRQGLDEQVEHAQDSAKDSERGDAGRRARRGRSAGTER